MRDYNPDAYYGNVIRNSRHQDATWLDAERSLRDVMNSGYAQYNNPARANDAFRAEIELIRIKQERDKQRTSW